MKKRPVGFRIAVGLLAIFALWSFGSCDSVFGSDDDDDSGGVEATSWILVHDTSVNHPFGGTYQISIIDKDESQMTITFYEETEDGVVQVAGGVLPYEVQGEGFVFEWSYIWLDEDPGVQGITYTGKDWYEIPAGAEAPEGGTAAIVGDTLIVTTNEEREFERIDFGLPPDMVGTWDLDLTGYTGDIQLGATSDAPAPGWGSLSYTIAGPDISSQEGSGYWKASGTTEGGFRQIYTEVSDDPGLKYWEHLNPYALAENTLTLYSDLAETEGDAYDYVRQ